MAITDPNDLLIKQNIGVPAGLNSLDETLTYEQVQFLVTNMPGVNSILEGIVDYIFAGEMELVKDEGNTVEGEELKEMLYSQNIQGITVIDMFKQLTRELFEQGSVGVRRIPAKDSHNGKKDSIMIVPKNTFDIIFREADDIPLVYLPYVYLLKRTHILNRKVRWYRADEQVTDNRFTIDENGNVVTEDKDWVALTTLDFTNITMDGSFIGVSPFENDKKRTLLILQLLDYFIHDFERNGIGTLAFKHNETMLSKMLAEKNPATSAKIFDNTTTNARFSAEQSEKNVTRLAQELAKVEYNDSIIYSDVFSDMQQLTRDSKPSDYLNLLSIHATRFSCQIYGVSPQVFDLDEGTGNIGKDEVIKTFTIHKVIPWREKIATKLTEVIRLMGYVGYTFRFKNNEIKDYYDYEKDDFISSTFTKLREGGLEDESVQYVKKHLVFEE